MRIRFLLFLLISTIFLGCNQGSKSKDYVTIATLKGPSAMGMIKLIDSLNHTSDKRIRVEILNEPIQVRKMVIDGTADFAILPTTMAAILYNRGIDYQLAAIPVWGTLYLFGTDTTITAWNMLRGKTINLMGKGMTPDVLFKHLLIENGINPDVDVRLDYRFPTHIDLANAVAAGQAKLGVISEPLVSLVMERNSKIKAIFDLNAEWQKVMDMPIAQTAFLVKGELANANKELVDRILKSYDYSTQWVNQNPDSAAHLIVKYDILPSVEVARKSIPRSNLYFSRVRSIRMEIESYLNVFYQMNPDIVGGRLPDENFYQ
ncbi:MAG: MqnA/MqnD/SBP family protein [Tenuifilaceae bacterium]|nr:MqnA/MqnD/SBP family protein [Tenuifilaceae bacterium]